MSIDVFFTNLQSFILAFAAIVGGLTTIGGALIWIYQKTFGKAKERRAEERNRLFQQALKENNEPLIKTLNALNKSMDDRERHDYKLDEIAAKNSEILRKHDETLGDHSERLVVVETTLDIKHGKKRVNYVEQYGGKEEE